MALPKIKHPVYQEIIPSTKETVWIRPYLVKEQKILQTLGESKDFAEIFQNMKNLVISCIESGNFNPEKLTVYDIQWLMLKLRSISVGDEIEQNYICKNEINGVACGATIKVKFKISDVQYKEPDNTKFPNNIVMLSDDIGVRLFYPRVGILSITDEEDTIKMIARDIDYIFTKSEKFTEFREEEAVEFLKSLTLEDFNKILEFYTEENLPKVFIKLPYKCGACGASDELELSTVMDFF